MDHDLKVRDLDPDGRTPSYGQRFIVPAALFLAGTVLLLQGIYTPMLLGRSGIMLPWPAMTLMRVSTGVGFLMVIVGVRGLVRALFGIR